ncbi:MAG: molybdopterin converting factor subunit 1 [Anaerolineae bacterium]|nr:molybdopterin converting factor subunit 1 [Anaerolineae bacterium]
MNKIKVLFFATFRDMAGAANIEMEIPDSSSVAQLKEIVVKTYPAMQPSMSSLLVAVNKDYAYDEDIIPEGAEVALFPPVSGGAGDTVAYITEDEINLNDILAEITRPSIGAACFFTGMVRGVTSRGEERHTEYLEYQAYKPMAQAKMLQVADEIRERWPAVEGIALVQRIGILQPETPTVMIACTAAHRDTGVFEAARYGIDRLKEIVPVWKKEVGSGGEEWIEGEYIPQRGE